MKHKTKNRKNKKRSHRPGGKKNSNIDLLFRIYKAVLQTNNKKDNKNRENIQRNLYTQIEYRKILFILLVYANVFTIS